MSNAIVTITCPWCGGRVEGLRATNVDQTTQCPYCRTELHVPRVGEVVHERVIREIIREVTPVSEIDPDINCMPSRRSNPLAGLVAGAIAFVILLAMLCVQHHEADVTIEQMQVQDRVEDACRQSCDDSCASAGDKEMGKGFDGETDRVMKDADITLCTAQCEEAHNCIGISPRDRERMSHRGS